ncbi:properdin-like [Hyperolius riggenbachi]|uniref:properdin-like n=1 Tax=Hyperolius riggenbachi TaxID=752182 RepID=UPI0035A306EC
MAPGTQLLLITSGILVLTLQTSAGSDNVLCYADVDRVTGGCTRYLGDGVSGNDCCLNTNYAFKNDANSPCQACCQAAWSEWSNWGACTVSCLEGVQRRQRVCIGQGECEGYTEEVQACTMKDCCPKNGGWAEWGAWSACSVTCGLGKRKRSRSCSKPAPICGGNCPGNEQEVGQCDTKQVCPTHGQWSNWVNWGPCTSSCRPDGSSVFPIQSRTRLCNNPPPSKSPPGNPCSGPSGETRECASVPYCPVDGGWGEWQNPSECSVTCGIGQKTQQRSCNNPAPRHGGKSCSGSPTKYLVCNTAKQCPIDGTWSDWPSNWSECTLLNADIKCTKKVGTQNRRRDCLEPQYGGEWCEGERRESRNCYNVDKCFYSGYGNWSEWSQWGLCQPPCGPSQRKRYKECLPQHKDYPLEVEDSQHNIVKVYFWGTPTFKCVAIDGQTKKVEESTECKNTIPCS